MNLNLNQLINPLIKRTAQSHHHHRIYWMEHQPTIKISNMNTSGTKKNSCKTNKNIPEPEKLQTQTRISNRHLWETNSQKLNTKAGICGKSKK